MNIETVNEPITSLESAGELSIREQKFLKLAKAYVDREEESVALALTFEKCREITNCPAGVDLQEHLRQLAAENVVLASSAECLLHEASEVYRAYNKTQLPDGDLVDGQSLQEVWGAINATPATDRIVTAQRSAFVDEAVAKITESGALTFGDCIVALCQLREGAK